MAVKFIVIKDNILRSKIEDEITVYDEGLPDHFTSNEIETEILHLSELIGVNKMPACLSDWRKYEKMVLVCNSKTALYFLDAHKHIPNASLWIINWPIKLASNPAGEIFNQITDMIEEAKILASK